MTDAAGEKLLSSLREEIALEALGCGGAADLVTLRDLVAWIDAMKADNHLRVKHEGLSTLSEWGYDNEGFYSNRAGKFFRIIGMCVEGTGREVRSWCQPIMDNIGTGVIGLLLGRHNGRIHFLMQGKADVGNRSLIQIAPTVQFTPSNYQENRKLVPPFLFSEFSGGGRFAPLWEGWQSEEGGRFYREQQRHRIMMLREGDRLDAPPGYIWMNISQIRFFIHFGEHVNACARSILSCLI